MAKQRNCRMGKPSKLSRSTSTPRGEKVESTNFLPQQSKLNSNSDVNDPCVLPTWTPLLVSLLAFAFRVHHVINPSSWWVVHPDEIFQSMEVAHSELYGYGMRPYEFNRQAKGDNLSHYELRELTLGMYALRSPIVPQYMVLVVWLVHTIGLDTSNPYLIFRLSHVAISSTLPVAVSKFALASSRDPDVASLAAILTGASAYLNVMGTHTLVNSFVSPAIFLGLAQVLKLIRTAQESPNTSLTSGKIPERERANDPYLDSATKESKCYNNMLTVGKEGAEDKLFYLKSSESTFHSETVKQNKNKRYLSDDNENNCSFKNYNAEHNSSLVNINHAQSQSAHNSKLNSSNTRKMDEVFERQIKIDTRSSVSDLGYESMESRSSRNSSTSSTNSTGTGSNNVNSSSGYTISSEDSWAKIESDRQTFIDTSPLDMGFANSLRKTAPRPQSMPFFTQAAIGCVLSLAIYIRPDSAIFGTLLLLTKIQLVRAGDLLHLKSSWFLVLGGALGLLLAAADDVFFYGSLVFSPLNWCRFNVLNGMASQLFGVSHASFYIRRIFLHNAGMVLAFLVFVTAGIVFVCSFVIIVWQNLYKDISMKEIHLYSANGRIHSEDGHHTKISNFVIPEKKMRNPLSLPHENKTDTHSLKSYILCVCLLTGLYSCMGHKEERFLHDVVVLFLVTVSETVILVINFMVTQTLLISNSYSKNSPEKHKPNKTLRVSFRLFAVGLVSFSFIAQQTLTFQACTKARTKEWVFASPASGLDTNLCLYYLSKRTDVSGVFIEHNIDAGGYTMLHRNVPLIYLLGNDYVEFTNSSLYIENRICVLCENRPDEAKKEGEDTDKIPDTYQKSSGNNTGGDKCRVGHYSITRVSDLIHKDNSQGLLAKLVGESSMYNSHMRQDDNRDFSISIKQNNCHPYKKTRYNYAIVRSGKQFLTSDFTVVYKTPSMWVWRRMDKAHTEACSHSASGSTTDGPSEELASTPAASRRVMESSADGVRNEVHKYKKSSFEATQQGERNAFVDIDSNTDNVGHLSNKNIYKDTKTSTKNHVKVEKTKHNDKNIDQSDKLGLQLNDENNFHSYSNMFLSSSKKDLIYFASSLEYEGEVLKQLGNYWQALKRFEALALITKGQDPTKETEVSILASTAFCLHRLGEHKKMQRLLKRCVTLYTRDKCLDGGRVRVFNLGQKTEA